MADNTIIRYSGQYIRNATGGTAGGAYLYVYNAGTTTLSSIYTDTALTVASNNPVIADAAGLLPFAYKGTGAYKVILKTSGGTTLDEEDNLPGALDTSTFAAATYAKVDADVQTKSTDYPMVAGDVGTTINGNCTGTTVQITLLSAVTVTNGRGVTIRHTGTSGQVKILTSASQTITSPKTGVTVTAFSLVGYGESVTLRADGAGWHVDAYVPPLMTPNTPGIIQITDRVSAAPSSPTPGARYIVSGAFDTFEQDDIIEADGQAAFIEYTPPTDCGWVAYVQDEDAFYVFVASAWVEDAATQTQMETGTDVVRRVTPGRQHNHPGHPKFWALVTVSGGTPTLASSYNVASVADTEVGRLTITFTTPFANTNYAVSVTAESTAAGVVGVVSAGGRATGTVEVSCINLGGSLADPSAWHVVGYGDQ